MPITPSEYVRNGPSSAWHVPDLVPANGRDIRLLFILESPHVDELETPRRPVVGEAGKSALKFLQGANWAGDSLGGFVAVEHRAGEGRLAVMNVSTVPLQVAAFERTAVPPDLTKPDWKWLGETFRKSVASTVTRTPSTKANLLGQILLDGLQDRIDQLALDSGCIVVACGRWVQRYVRELQRMPGGQLDVPHPANNQWHPVQSPVPKALKSTRQLFRRFA